MKQLKTMIVGCLAALTMQAVQAQTIVNQYGAPENFSDVVLIYAGNSNRNSWNTRQLTPYVTHTYSDGHEDWLFDAFLFMEFIRDRTVDGEYSSVGFGNGLGGAHPATQEDWEWILNEYITTGSSYNITKLGALDQVIEEKKQTLGTPPYRHKVIVVCPAPKKNGATWSRSVWGTVNGRNLKFTNETDRLDAVKWYIDELVARFAAANYRNIDLEGIYWVEESLMSNAGIIERVNDYARSKGLRTYWIPYYRDGNEAYCQKWKGTFKFDMAYFQPNYAFYTDNNGGTMPISQLAYTCNGAKKYGAGLEMEFETSGTSNALHSVDPAAHQRINDYMDVFTAQGVFDNAGVAYYVGTRGLNDMKASTDPVDHATMDRMASIVKARLDFKFGNENALEEVAMEGDWAYAGYGRILTTEEASLYDMAGRLIHKGIGLFECNPGVYVVHNSKGDCTKLAVR